MERTKYLLVVLFALFNCALYGQNNQSIYKAYTNGNMSKWKYSMDSIDAIKLKTNKEVLDLINYQYGYIAWCISKKHSVEAERYLKKAIENQKQLEQKKHSVSMRYAYKAAFVGYEIGLSPYKAPFLGPRSLEYAKKSVSLDSLNALGYMQLGNIAYYTPKIFGGSKTEALEHYLEALKIMERHNEFKASNWNYLNLLATLIKAYIELNQYETAKEYCIKTLAVEPGFDWVKNNLYPEVLKNLKQ